MKRRACLPLLLIFTAVSFPFWGCRGSERIDTEISSVANPGHTYRATIVQRQYLVDGKQDSGPTTFVLLDPGYGRVRYGNGEDFNDSRVVMKPVQCGPLRLTWASDTLLKITCDGCGLALSAAGPHAGSMGPVKIEYDGFPDVSSWEGAAH
jgi:hypothetical protein